MTAGSLTCQGVDRSILSIGGSSNITFGTGDGDQKQSSWPSKTATNIFGGPVDPHAGRRNNPPGLAVFVLLSLNIFDSNFFFSPSSPPPPHLKANVEEHECVPEDKEPSNSVASNAAPPAAGGPSNRRNPPGGKSSLVLG
uniref:Uncharacterized protein n=1 Tax=Erpetoichthys calabaricus TaxID=27687 RepID=A0A8C4STM1_ERPCA